MKKRHLFWIIPSALITLILLLYVILKLISVFHPLSEPFVNRTKHKTTLTEKELNRDLDYIKHYMSTCYAGYDDMVEKYNMIEIATGKTWQYLYQQNKETDSCCGITALTNDEFIVIERDGNFSGEKEAHKYLFKINLNGATDVNGDMTAEKGILIDGKTLEQCTQSELLDSGITFVKKELITDLVATINYGHDKLEGLWLLDDNTICVANDNDFALIEKDNKLCQKILPGTETPEDDVIYSVKF